MSLEFLPSIIGDGR